MLTGVVVDVGIVVVVVDGVVVVVVLGVVVVVVVHIPVDVHFQRQSSAGHSL